MKIAFKNELIIIAMAVPLVAVAMAASNAHAQGGAAGKATMRDLHVTPPPARTSVQGPFKNNIQAPGGDTGHRGGVNVAVGDVNGDGTPDTPVDPLGGSRPATPSDVRPGPVDPLGGLLLPAVQKAH